MRDDSDWGMLLPGVVPPASTPANSTPSRTPDRSSIPIITPAPTHPSVGFRNSTRAPSPLPLLFFPSEDYSPQPLPSLLESPVVPHQLSYPVLHPSPRINQPLLDLEPPVVPPHLHSPALHPSPRVIPSRLDSPVVAPRLSSPAIYPSSPRVIPPHLNSPVVPPPVIHPSSPQVIPSHLNSPVILPRTSSPARYPSSPRVIPSRLDSPVVQPRPSSSALRPSSSPRPTPNPPMTASTPNPQIFIPPTPRPTPPPPQPTQRPRRVSGPLVGERQGWAYPLDLGGTGLSYPNHSTPYNPYTPLPAPYTPYLYPPYLPPPFTPQVYPPHPLPLPFYGPHPPPPLYATTPVAPFQSITVHNHASPWLPPGTQKLPDYALPADTSHPPTALGGGAASIPLPPPQPPFVTVHPDIFALGGGLTALDWDLIYPPTPDHARLFNPTSPYARPNFSEPAFSSPMETSKVWLRSSSHPVLAYWMDVWGPFTVDGDGGGGNGNVPSVGTLLRAIFDYLHRDLTREELDLLVTTPENKENVARAREIRAKEGCELVLKGALDDGYGRYKRLDVLGMHRKFAGCWVGSISESEGGGMEVELMVGVRPLV